MKLQTRGVRKYPSTSALLASSAGLGWSTISAELRSHGVIEAPEIVPQHVEICLVVAGNKDGLVRRTGAGFCQEAMPKTGAIWLSPAGVGKEIVITAPIPQTMHLYLPTALFDRLKDDFNLPAAPAHSIRHAVGIGDDVIDQIGRSILSELNVESAASRLYVEAASLTLAARLLQKHCDSGACTSTESSARSLDHVRLRRVLDYIAANIGDDITLVDLAGIAGYSPFHFARKFTFAMGISPHRYISRIRLENAMAELAAGKLPLAEIALNAQFSSQASFTRAFHRAIGMTPKEYQRRRLRKQAR
jgi:AraC family transcriptional regulator